MRRYCLFKLIPQPGLRLDFKDELLEKIREAEKATGIDDLGVIVLEVDALQNSLIICPPMLDAHSKKVTFTPGDYDTAIRDKKWPVLLVDVTPVVAIRTLSPYELADRVGPKEVKTPITPIDGKSKD